jgi:hypothetical protein
MPGPRGEASAVVNPYRDSDPALDRPGAARRRRQNLEAYLDRVGTPRVVLLGEAIGFRGGRFSGIAFTSERQLAGDSAAGNAGRRLAWAGPPFEATSTRPELWLEPSASIVWGALGGDPRGVLLWNAFPWHPYDPHSAKGPLSNRTPERRLLTANLHVLEELLAATPEARTIAVGRTAQTALGLLGVEAPLFRHPAYGGAAIFRRQLAEVLHPPGQKPPAQKPVLR